MQVDIFHLCSKLDFIILSSFFIGNLLVAAVGELKVATVLDGPAKLSAVARLKLDFMHDKALKPRHEVTYTQLCEASSV